MDAETRRSVAWELTTAFLLFALFLGMTMATRKPTPPYLHAAIDGDRVFRLIVDWEFCGPFEFVDGDLEKDWAGTDYPAELVARCDAESLWRPIERKTGESHTALEIAFPGRENVYALARSRLRGWGRGPREIRVGSDDGAVAWFDKAPVYHSSTVFRSFVPDQDRFEVTLDGDSDELVFRLVNGTSAWWFAARVEDPSS